MKRIFCNAENAPFPANDFVEIESGSTVHVTERDGSGGPVGGHTLDGWFAELVPQPPAHWEITGPSVANSSALRLNAPLP
jgi:hypothetical protein